MNRRQALAGPAELARACVLALGVAAGSAAPAAGQLVPQPRDFDPEKGAVRTYADRSAYEPGSTARFAVVLEIEDGWHTNSHIPTYEGLIGTSVALEPPPGWAAPAEPDYPPGEMKSFSFATEPISVYEGEVAIHGRIEVPPGTSTGTYPIRARVTYQACDDKMCLPPVTVEETIAINVGPGGEAANTEVFAGGGSRAGPGATGRRGLGAAPSPGSRGLLWFLLLGFVGGLILNAMPCVLPVLSLKLFGLVKSAEGGRGAVAAGGLATAAGILFSFWILAAAAIIARSAGVAVGWGIQFQEPAFVSALAVIILLFSLNLWGLFEIPLPRFLGRVGSAGPSEGLAGHVTTGFFATLMATPCSAPFLGTALGFALTQSAAMTVGTFSAIGLGMASPYLVLAAFPKAGRILPRPGPWMGTFRVVMGFFLAATAVWLLYVLSSLVTPERLAFFELSLLAIALGVWLRARRREEGAARRVASVAVLALCVTGVAIAARGGGSSAPAVAAENRLISWVPFDRAEAERRSAEGRYVFVDVTADWCLTCKVNERLFLETREVADAFERHRVIAMKADWTRRDEAIGEFLADFGRYGIPFYVMYRPGREPHVFSELLSKSAILDLLDGPTEVTAASARD